MNIFFEYVCNIFECFTFLSLTPGMSLVPALLDSLQPQASARRPSTQAHLNWELMRVRHALLKTKIIS